MKTLFVGDLHLQQALILPKVAKVVAQEKIERVIFTGDYVDGYGQKNNSTLFLSALDLLKDFKEEHLKKGIE
ncbi:metallophosphoesterase family protein, partial [Enterococcus cecorum]